MIQKFLRFLGFSIGSRGTNLYEKIIKKYPAILKDHWGEDIWIHLPTETWAIGKGSFGSNKLFGKIANLKGLRLDQVKKEGKNFFSRRIGESMHGRS
ncbi:hypothetical protein HYW94_01350 [Candidatus Uhrbacteria bacterium]|nr:hypothetical protein [Candidatus Uhrbacteria bacterium]